MWILVETYYKHAQYQLHIFHSDQELMDFILSYNYYEHEVDIHSHDLSLDDLIFAAISSGNYNVDNQIGWVFDKSHKFRNTPTFLTLRNGCYC